MGRHHDICRAMEGTMKDYIQGLADSVIAGQEIAYDDALRLGEVEGSELYHLLSVAGRIREHFVGKDCGHNGLPHACIGAGYKYAFSHESPLMALISRCPDLP